MALIPIDPSLNISEEAADFMDFLIKEDRDFAIPLTLPQILISKIRPGMDSDLLASSILARFDEIGIPRGALEGGHKNVMEHFVQVLAEEIVDMLQNDMRIDVAVDAGVIVTANGANAGGPLIAVGASTAPHTGVGVAR